MTLFLVTTMAVSFVPCAGVAAGAVPARAPTSASEDTKPVEIQWNRELLRSGKVEQIAAAIAQQNKETARAADAPSSGRLGDHLSLERLGATLRFDGKYASVSAQGLEVIALIRQVPARKGKELNDVLARLLKFSQQGVPEAQNFCGFVYEYGLFGASSDIARARRHYEAAAARRYQPSFFNLANMAYFGKGQPRDPMQGYDLVRQAMSIGDETSSRVCGLASYIAYKNGEREAAGRYSVSCYSALANIPVAVYGTQMPLARRMTLLRDSISTGATDGYQMLEEITRTPGPDKTFLHCKYQLVNRIRPDPDRYDVNALARACYAGEVAKDRDQSDDRAIRGIASFAVTESRSLAQLGHADRFHYTWSVPYLPFTQADVDLFTPIMKGVP